MWSFKYVILSKARENELNMIKLTKEVCIALEVHVYSYIFSDCKKYSVNKFSEDDRLHAFSSLD